MSAVERSLGGLEKVMGSWRFAVFVVSLLLFSAALLGSVLVIPPGAGALSAFAADFKTWCFGYDPASGQIAWASAVILLGEPLLLALVVVALWRRPLGRLRQVGLWRVLPWASASLVLVLIGGAALGMLWRPSPQGELPFPAERLRTSLPPPSFRLDDQEGEPVSLDELRGKVVLLTGVYATCGHTCPLIMQQAKRAVQSVEASLRGDIVVVGVTIDPERDTPEAFVRMAEMQGLSHPQYRLLTGKADEVNPVLDHMGIARKRDAATGVIDHTNVFLLLDRQGRVAYRFSLGETQERWLGTALDLLVRQSPTEQHKTAAEPSAAEQRTAAGS